MGLAVANDVLDAALDKIATATRLTVCSGEPADLAGIAAVLLADVTLVPGDGNGDYVVGDGDASGRKVRVQAQSAIPVDASGTATHVCLDDGTTLLAVTTCDSAAITSGGNVSMPAFDVEVADPEAEEAGVTLDFYSAWDYATGESSDALMDGPSGSRKWDSLSPESGEFSVIDGDAVGWTLTPNVLRFLGNGSGGDGMVNVNVPYWANRTDFYLRFWARYDSTSIYVNHSPSFPQSGALVWGFSTEGTQMSGGAGWTAQAGVRPLNDGTIGGTNFGYALSNGSSRIYPLDPDLFYRFEYLFEFVSESGGTVYFRCWPRIYNMAGDLLYDVNDFADVDQPSVSLQDVYDDERFCEASSTACDAATNMAFGIGENVWSNGTEAAYHAAVAVSTEGWIGDQLGS